MVALSTRGAPRGRQYARPLVTQPDGPALQYRLLGGLAAVRDAEPIDLGGRKQRAVLASLLLRGGRSVTADRLIDDVWGDRAPPRAGASLQAYVSKLRRLLGPDDPGGAHRAIVTESGGYRLVTQGGGNDLVRFPDPGGH